MRQGEPVGEFYDRLNILVNCAKNALKEMIPRQDAEPTQLACKSRYTDLSGRHLIVSPRQQGKRDMYGVH